MEKPLLPFLLTLAITASYTKDQIDPKFTLLRPDVFAAIPERVVVYRRLVAIDHKSPTVQLLLAGVHLKP
jgi:hypothetical protein